MLYEKKAMAKGRSVKVFALVLALLLSLSFPVLADGSYTVMGTVYGNGIVMLNGTTFTGTALNSTGDAVFTFAPGAANTVTEFLVNGTPCSVTNNTVTVPAVGGEMVFEAVFSAANGDVNVTRETEPCLMENGVLSATGKEITDSVSKLTMQWSSGGTRNPVGGQYGYEITQNTRDERGLITRGRANGGLFKAGIGRTYQPSLHYKNTHPTWNVSVWTTLEMVSGGYLNGTDTRSLLNGTWGLLTSTIDSQTAYLGGAVTQIQAPNGVTVTSMTNTTDGAAIGALGDYATVETVTFHTARCGGIGTEHMYIHGISFEETTPYHGVVASIGEGSMTLSSDSLNFGTDNDQILMRDSSVAAVEHGQDAAVTLRAPEGHLIRSVTWTPTKGSPVAITEGLGSSVSTFTLKNLDSTGTLSAQYDAVQSDVTLTFHVTGNGQVGCGEQRFTDGSILTVKANEDVLLSLLPDADYEIGQVLLDNIPITPSNATVEIKGVSKDIDVSVTFHQKEEVKPSMNVYGEVTIDKNYVAPGESDACFSALLFSSLDAGYGWDILVVGVEVRDDAGHILPLPIALENITNDGRFGLRVYGPGLETGKSYEMTPYATILKDGQQEKITGGTKVFTVE